jgi:hypothetical protein
VSNANANLIMKNNFIETHDSRTIASQGIAGTIQKNMIILNTDQQNSRKAPSSAHHSKKPSGSGINAIPTITMNSAIN